MKIEFNYGDIKFEVDSATHEIYINGELASGAYAPVGGIVIDMDVETPDICEVITNINGTPEEKIIIYGAPLSIKEPVIILGDWVIPSSLMVRNDLQGDYEVYKALLGEDYLRLLGEFNSAADSAKNEINAAKEEVVKKAEEAVTAVSTKQGEAVSAVNSAKGTAVDAVNDAKEEAISQIGGSVGRVYRPKGTVSTYGNLPMSGNEVGDVYTVLDTGAEYFWKEDNSWEYLGEKIDLSAYAKKSDVPSVEGLASTKYVDGEIDKIEAILGQLDTALAVTESEVI